jgi:hypothetical protein
MSEVSGPRFPGELSEHLEPRGSPEAPDRWSDRLRHALVNYLFVAIVFTVRAGALGGSIWATVTSLGDLGWSLVMFIAISPGAVYLRILEWRILTGRDPNTGERMRPPDR